MNGSSAFARDRQRPRWSAALLVALVAAGALLWHRPHAAIGRSADPYAVFCMPVPRPAVVPPGLAADRVVDVDVPRETPSVAVLGTRAYRPVAVRRGEVVEFRVSTPREGAVAVHGLSDLVRLRADSQGVVRFRAIYSGRFPLHFHGPDMSHFEIAVLEIAE